MHFIVLLILVFAPCFGFSWNQSVLDGITPLDSKLSKNSPFYDSFEFSLWSSIRAKVYDPDKTLKKISSRFLEKKVKVAYQLKDPKVPVLYVYVPGIFNNVTEGQTRRAFVRMTNLSPNVLVLPNPWGTNYIKSRPKHKPGDILREAESLHDLTLNFIKSSMMPPETRVYLYGASYGGFLAAVMANIDRELGTNIVHKEVYVFSPPLNMKQAIRNLDELMFEDDFLRRKVSDKDLAFVFLDYVFANRSSDLNVKSRLLTQDVVVREGFKDPFREALKIYFKDHPDYDRKKKDYYFSSYIKTLAPELDSLLNSEVAEIEYWVRSGVNDFDLDIKVLTTTNDFLNTYVFPGTYPQGNFWVFRSGGHLGFIEMPEFEHFLVSTNHKARTAW